MSAADELLVSGATTTPDRELLNGAQGDSHSSHKGFYVSISPWSFLLCWIIIAVVHVLCIGTFGLECWVYWHLPDAHFAVAFAMYEVMMPLSDFHVLSLVHGAIAAAHCLLLLHMLIGSICSRHLAFFISAPTSWKARSKELPPRNVGKPSTKLIVWLKKIRSTLSRVHASVFGRRGLLGFEGKYFGYVYILREVFETVLQSNQAYYMSQLVPHVAINRFFVLVIVLNCWMTPIIQRLFTHNPPLERLLCLVFDVALDFVSVVGIPTRLAVPYLKQYDANIRDFSTALWYDDMWLVSMIHELRLVFISSWSDLASQIVFCVNLIMNLQVVKRLLRSSSGRTGITLSERRRSTIIPVRNHTVGSDRFASKAIARISSLIPTQATSTRLKKLVHTFLALWGLMVLVLHVRVSFGSTPSHCIMMARPWFGTKSGCALMYVNCKTIEGATGTLEELSMAMDTIDKTTLTHFVVRHCPHVEIPPQLQSFPNLIGLKLYNSTLVSWSADAALTGKHHPKMLFLLLVDVSLTDFPLGLQSDDFPQKLLDIEFSGTNLSVLPDDLDQKWPHGGLVAFERSLFTHVPETVIRMAPAYLSMAQNLITEVPVQLLTTTSISLWFGRNPIRKLPESLTPFQAMVWLDLRFCELEAVPSWVDNEFFDHVLLTVGGSPICDQLMALGANSSVISNLREAWKGYQRGQLSCQMPSGADDSSMKYPYKLEAELDLKYSHGT